MEFLASAPAFGTKDAQILQFQHVKTPIDGVKGNAF
jgi:hypothetical protein